MLVESSCSNDGEENLPIAHQYNLEVGSHYLLFVVMQHAC